MAADLVAEIVQLGLGADQFDAGAAGKRHREVTGESHFVGVEVNVDQQAVHQPLGVAAVEQRTGTEDSARGASTEGSLRSSQVMRSRASVAASACARGTQSLSASTVRAPLSVVSV